MKKGLLILLCLPMIGFGQNIFKNTRTDTKTSENDICPPPKNLLFYVIKVDNICENLREKKLDIFIDTGRLSLSGNKIIKDKIDNLSIYDSIEVIIGSSQKISLTEINSFNESLIIDYHNNDKIYVKGYCNGKESDSIRVLPYCLSPHYRKTGVFAPENLNIPPTSRPQLNWTIELVTSYQDYYYNILNDFPLNNNEEFDLYTDKSQVPYNYKPVIKFGFINSGNKADLNIKSMASCLGVDGIIKETNTRLTKSTELNPLYDVLFNDMPAEKNELVEETVVSYTLIIKDTSHQQVKDNLDKYELLLRLAELKEKGIISEKEFQEEKKKLLQEQ